MSDFDINSIKGDLESSTIDALKSLGLPMAQEAAVDVVAFIQNAAPKLTKYASLYLSGQIDEDDLKSLTRDIKDLSLENALSLAGLEAIKVDSTRSTLLKAVTSVIIGQIGKIV